MNGLKINIKSTLLLLFLCFVLPAKAAGGQVDVQEVVFSHIQDAYTWHITKWEGREIAVPLPVWVRSEERGWFFFSSGRLHHGASYQGFYIATEGTFAGKIVEKDSRNVEVRPLDLSLTKNVWGLFFSCGLLLSIILQTARWYNKHPDKIPGGFIGLVEMTVCYIENQVIKEGIGKSGYKPYSAYLLTVFFFILINNLLGIIPIFPGGANLTGNIAVTAVLALGTFIAVNAFASATYWKEIFWPNAPLYLKVPLPIMPFVEIFGVFTKPFALMIRLFANIMAGHSIILALTCLIFITVPMGKTINVGMTAVSVLFSVFMNLLELLVACLQAYIFTLLSANYIGMSKVKEEKK